MTNDNDNNKGASGEIPDAVEVTTRTRTRTRTTAGSSDDSSAPAKSTRAPRTAAKDSGGDSGSKDSGADNASAGSGDDDGDSSSSRRRRGRRGGRGRGGQTDGQDDADATDTSTKESSSSSKRDSDDASGDGGRSGGSKNDEPDGKDGSGAPSGSKSSRGGRNKKRGKGGKGKSNKGGGGGGRGDGGGNQEPQRGSTRVQAKKGGHGRRQVQGIPESVRRAMMDGPPKTMLVTTTDERTQIAVLEERTVVEHYVTRKSDVTLVGNMYMARVQNVLPGMEAAFLDIGKGRNGVLYAGEVAYDDLDVEESTAAPRIEDALKAGQTVLVQVTKDAMGTKGPRLTMELSLAGRYTVLVPNSTVFGISRKLTDKERDRLRKIVKTIKPKEHGVIVRTAGEEITEEALLADIQRLLDRWEAVEAKAKEAEALTPVYEEPPLHVKVIRDMFGTDYEACIIDDLALHDEVKGYLSEVAPDLAEKIDLYGTARYDLADREAEEGAAPVERSKFASLFDAYNTSQQLQKAMGRKIWLKSGGYLIVESTEAMKVIDVNTGKFTGGAKSSLEEVVLKTNLEAAEEIVRQLRLRDMGGIIVIDFIDMLLKANRDQVVAKLERELLRDRTKTRVSDVSNLGLVQMTRKNVSQGLVESFSHKCESCEGHGYISELD